jgi:hypothetical protein
MRNLVFLLLISVNYNVSAQQTKLISIQGIVKSAYDDQPIDYAVCFLKNNEFIGDVTDSTGFFTMIIPDNLSYDSIEISSLGYEKLIVPYQSLDKQKDTTVFFLKRKMIILDEIIVREEGYDLKNMVFAAIEKIQDNYPKNRHQLEGLYRKVTTEGNLYTYLEEASVTIEDQGYSDYLKPPKIKINALRMSKDYGRLDSLMLHLTEATSQKAAENFAISQNPLYRVLDSNYLHLFLKEHTRFNYETFSKYLGNTSRYKLMDVIITAKDTIYQIAFNDGPLPQPPSGNTYLKINVSDLAIVEYQVTSSFSDDYILHQVFVKFKKEKDGRYYPCFIKTIQPRLINREIDDGEYDIETYWFHEVKTKDLKKIKSKESINRFDVNSYKRKYYNPGFWKNMDSTGQYTLDKGVRSSLEKHQSLEEQFKETGQK